jgi:drug/metabolite transporter (DMT)-like permease
MASPSVTSSPPAAPPAARRATLVGGGAILLWSTLASLTALAGPIPPFQLVAMTMAVGGSAGLAAAALAGRRPLAAWRQPARAWALGVGGLFGYHALYFLALQTAPVAEANLLNYLWPLLIVLFAGLLPGERLGPWQFAGALAGLAGTALLVTGGGRVALDPAFAGGYGAALACAVVWGGYSVLSRRLGAVPTDAVSGFCLAAALLALTCHLALEPTRWPAGPAAWAVVAAMGLGPMGAAFFLWDHGVKRGDIQALGALSYATPLLSTLALLALGLAAPGWGVWQAALLIVAGAVLAGRGLARRR